MPADPGAVRRGYLTVDGRQVHYRIAGEGPPLVLLHQSPKSTAELEPHLARLAARHTAIAFDRPGYGGSDPLPGAAEPTMEGYLDNLVAVMDQLGIGPVPVYGSRTGAIEVVAMARHHPGRFTAAVIDGMPIFTPAAIARTIEESLTFTPKPEGGHLAWAWNRVRDRWIFFPWYEYTLANRLDMDVPPVAAIHDVFMDILRAGAWYSTGPKAAIRYDYIPDIAALPIPATYISRSSDQLFSHLDKLPPLPAGSRIERLGPDNDAWLDHIAALMEPHRGTAPLASIPKPAPIPGRIVRGYADTPFGQVFYRLRQDRAGTPLVLLHDAALSSALIEPLIDALAATRPVYALDLPGSGETRWERPGLPGIDDYAAVVRAAVADFGLKSYDLHGIGAGAAVAATVAAADTDVRKLVLQGILLPGDALVADLRANYGAPLVLHQDGRHLFTSWHMLRDHQLFWPWYRRTAYAVRRIEPDLAAAAVHNRLVEVFKNPDHWHALALAAFAAPLRGILPRLRQPVLVCSAEADVGHADRAQVAALVSAGQQADLPASPAGAAAAVARFLG
jgi:pimeloyl-ACP methyl ester carboxylesterase